MGVYCPPSYQYPGCKCSPQTGWETSIRPVVTEFTPEMKKKLEGIEEGANKYVLPTADENTLGGIKIGKGLKMDENGTLSVESDGGCDCGDTHIFDGGDADGEIEFVQYLDGGSAGGL